MQEATAKGYAGLPRGLPAFLGELEANNSRDWFEAHRSEYEALWLKPALDLAAALSGPVAVLGLMAVPKLNASVRRINRDVRFSADKSPYNPRLHLLLSTGAEFNRSPGVHLVFSAQGFGFGVGHYGFTPAGLEQMRAAFCDDIQRHMFLAALARAEAHGVRLTAPDLAKVPKGLPSGHDWDHLLCRKHLVARTPEHTPFPDWLFTTACVPGLVDLVADLAPVAQWLTRFAG